MFVALKLTPTSGSWSCAIYAQVAGSKQRAVSSKQPAKTCAKWQLVQKLCLTLVSKPRQLE